VSQSLLSAKWVSCNRYAVGGGGGVRRAGLLHRAAAVQPPGVQLRQAHHRRGWELYKLECNSPWNTSQHILKAHSSDVNANDTCSLSLKAPGFNPRTYKVISWFQSLLLSNECNLYRYAAEVEYLEILARRAHLWSLQTDLRGGGCKVCVLLQKLSATVQAESIVDP
jgi:hypothetical protein